MTVHSLHCAARHVSRRTVGGHARRRLSKSVLSTARPARAQARRGAPSPAHASMGSRGSESANVIFSDAIVKLSLSLSELAAPLGPAGAARRGAARSPRTGEERTDIEYRSCACHGGHGAPCAVSRAPHGPHTPHKNLVTPRRARRHTSALTSGPPERRLAHAHSTSMDTSSSVLLAMTDLPQASTGASGFA